MSIPLVAAMPLAFRPLAALALLAALWATLGATLGAGPAVAATWQEHRDAGFLAFADADYAASAEHLERALAAADPSQADARERGVMFERLTTAYLATRWFRPARASIARWDRILEDSRGAPWANEQRSVRDGLAVLVTEVIGEAEPEAAPEATAAAAAVSPELAGEAPPPAGEGSGFEAEVDVPFAPDAPLPVSLAVGRPVEAVKQPSAVSAAAASAAAGGYGLHLVSLTDEATAAGSWATLQEAYPELLAGKDLAVRQVDLGDRGIYYRVHAAAYAAPESAQATCERLRALDQYCAVVDLK